MAPAASGRVHHIRDRGLPPGCTAILSTTSVIVPISANAVTHTNVNKHRAWFTETVTATAELVTARNVVATGHETESNGGALNQLFMSGKTVARLPTTRR